VAKRFVFRFETLLKIRRQREDQHKRIVAERVRQIMAARDRLTSLHQQISVEEAAIRDGQAPGTLDMQQIVRHRHWLGHLHRCMLDTEGSIRVLEGRLAQERAALAEAVKQRKILDKLKDQRLERHLHEEQRQETNAADDLTTVRYVFGREQTVELTTEN
jgi:flagellar FliJ protein